MSKDLPVEVTVYTVQVQTMRILTWKFTEGKVIFVLGVKAHQFLLPGVLLGEMVSLCNFSSKLDFQAVSVKMEQSTGERRQPRGGSPPQLSLLPWACLWSHRADGWCDFVRCTVPTIKLWQRVLKINALSVSRCCAALGIKGHAENMKQAVTVSFL